MHPLGNKRRSYPSDARAGNLYNHYMKRLAFLFLFLGLCLGLQAKTRVEIAEENSPAIVAVNVLKKDGSTFTGTGFVVSEDGVIATSGHVIQDALYMNITFNTGAVSGQAVPLAAAEKVDLALLKIGARNLPAVTLGDSDYILPRAGNYRHRQSAPPAKYRYFRPDQPGKAQSRRHDFAPNQRPHFPQLQRQPRI